LRRPGDTFYVGHLKGVGRIYLAVEDVDHARTKSKSPQVSTVATATGALVIPRRRNFALSCLRFSPLIA
jgi:hypothetical protein